MTACLPSMITQELTTPCYIEEACFIGDRLHILKTNNGETEALPNRHERRKSARLAKRNAGR